MSKEKKTIHLDCLLGLCSLLTTIVMNYEFGWGTGRVRMRKKKRKKSLKMKRNIDQDFFLRSNDELKAKNKIENKIKTKK